MAASFVIVVAGMRAAASIVVPVLLSVFIAIIATPAVFGLQRRGVPMPLALLLVAVLLVVATLGAMSLIGQSLVGFTNNLPRYTAGLEQQTDQVIGWLQRNVDEDLDPRALGSITPQRAMHFVGGIVSALSGLLGNAFLIVLVTIFMLLEAAILPAKMRALMSDSAWSRLQAMATDVRRYLAMKAVLSALTGLLVTILLALLGVDFPIMLGALAFLLNFVPNIGSFIAAIPGVLLALVLHGPGMALLAAGGYIVINVGVGNVLEPRVMGRQLGLSALVILLSLIFWGWVLGPVGMLLSVPLTMLVRIALEGDPATRPLASLLGSGTDTATSA